MRCKLCGIENREHAKFCESCGAELLDSQTSGLSNSYKTVQNFSSDEAMDSGLISKIVVKNEEYFINAFRQIESGKNKFNWAALFLGVYYALYRKDRKAFIRLFLPLIIFPFLYVFVGIALSFYLGLFTLMFIMDILSILYSISTLAVSIYYGMRFNKNYYKTIKKDIEERRITTKNIEYDDNERFVSKKYGTSLKGVIIYAVISICALTFTLMY